MEYRHYVDKHMLILLEGLNPQNASTQAILQLLTLGINHEQQHQELLVTDIKYMLGHNPIFPALHQDYELVNQVDDQEDVIETLDFDAGIYAIGHKGDSFCYDNELGHHQVFLEPFSIQNRLITNSEYIEFIADDAYQNVNLWLDDAWAWIQAEKVNAPLYWHHMNGEWFYYTLAGLKKISPDAPVCHISHYEANAFATWKNKRLPTEFEWEAAARKFNWGQRWEWTASAYLPYPGFKKADGAVGEYNGKFMSNKMVLRGASVATPAGHSRLTYRNFFHPSERWQYSGFRLAM